MEMGTVRLRRLAGRCLAAVVLALAMLLAASAVQPSAAYACKTSTKASAVIVNRATVDAKAVRGSAKKAGTSLGKVKTVTLGTKVKTIKKSAFKGCSAKTLVVKTTKLTKKSAKGSLKGSKVTTIVVDTGSEMADVDAAHWLTGVFTKANCGKKVTVTWNS